MIASIDRGFFTEVLAAIDLDRVIVAVTADHATSCVRKAHTAEPVPLVVAGNGVRSDGSTAFGERACASGTFGILRGPTVLRRIEALLRMRSTERRALSERLHALVARDHEVEALIARLCREMERAA